MVSYAARCRFELWLFGFVSSFGIRISSLRYTSVLASSIDHEHEHEHD